MSDGVVQVAPDSTGKKIDTSELTVSAQTVERQRVVIASDGTAAGLADVTNAVPASTAYGLPVRTVGDMYVALNAASVTAVVTLGTWETTGYQSFNVQVSGTFSASMQFEESNDNTNWTQIYYYNSATTVPSSPLITITGAVIHGYGFIRARYLRLRCTSFTSNTSSAITVVLRAAALPAENINVAAVGSISSPVQVGPQTSFMTSTYQTTAFVKAAATTNATSVKASAGSVFGMALNNASNAIRYIKFYNKASAPTVGTDVPVAQFAIPANGGTVAIDHTWAIPKFSTGIAYAITGGIADADTTAIAANEVCGWITYA